MFSCVFLLVLVVASNAFVLQKNINSINKFALAARMEHIVCSNPSEFDATLSKALAVDKPCFVLFTGAKNTETGKSWCPDCVVAEPIINSKFETLNVTLIECPVIREDYRQPTYLYRVHEKIRLRCVPTLHKFNSKTRSSIASLDDNQSQIPELIEALVNA